MRKLTHLTQGLIRNSLKDRKLFIHPRPKEDESFSSWLCRLAVANGSTPINFFNLHLAEHRVFLSTDVDWVSEDSPILDILSWKTGFQREELYSLTINSYQGYLFEHQKRFNSNKPFIIPAAFRAGKNRNFAIRYCPLCLRETEYFRKKWRLTFYTVCTKHKVFLLDKCPECGKPLTIQRWNPEFKEFHCYNCGFKFKNAKAEKVPEESKGIRAVNRIYQTLHSGVFEFEGRVYYSLAFFSVLDHFIKVVYNWKKRNHPLLHKEEEILNIKLSSNSKGRLYYKIPLKEQYLLFTVLADILSSRENLDKFIKDNKLGKTELTHDFYSYPFWYQEFVYKYDQSTYSPSTEEIKNAIEYMKRNKFEINWKNLRKVVGIWLDRRKRKDILYYIGIRKSYIGNGLQGI